MKLAVATIISGGQTGADRGALDAAIELSIPHGGRCPKGRKSEDGMIPPRYKLTEVDSRDYPDRSEANVVEGDGTLICTFGRLSGGSKLTAELARKHSRPFLHLDLNAEATDYAVKTVREWLEEHDIKTLNVAGSRESEAAGLHGAVKDLLLRVFR
ncbi:MAG: putative molybdenum carrier protein [Planctomycetes bacterium]|nr:putative molybdenum carrier protein [Planctomycetota bacterium]MCW8135872.1 putative molybdenum carrier protein [Planctomycetota bacterium]